jgi:hypothetical protein
MGVSRVGRITVCFRPVELPSYVISVLGSGNVSLSEEHPEFARITTLDRI